MTSWFAVHTKPAHELVAVVNFGWLGLEAYCPLTLHHIRHARAEHRDARAYFPRYVFLRAQQRHPQWARALDREQRASIGVSAIVNDASGPLVIPEVQIAELRSREVNGIIPSTEGPTSTKFYVGQVVRGIKGGTVEGLLFTIQQVDGHERASVWGMMFGREVRASVPTSEIEPVA